MKNKFTITDNDETLLVSVQFNSNVNREDKKKLYEIILVALDMWGAKEQFAEEIEKIEFKKEHEE